MVQSNRTRVVVAAVLFFTLVWITMVVLVGIKVSGNFRVGLTSCLPSDFPNYPRAMLASLVVSGSGGNCLVTYRTKDSSSEVQSFYRSNLNTGDWTVTAINEPTGTILFQRVSRPQTTGYVKILVLPGETQFQIRLRAG